MGHRERGISLLELVVVLAVILILAGGLFSILNRYQGIVERDMVEMNIRNMRMGMQLRVAQLLLEGRQREVSTLVGANPVQWLNGNLSGYIGELDVPLTDRVRGNWYFDRSQKMLVFRPNSTAFPGGDGIELRWQVVLSGGQDSGITLVEAGVGQ